MGERQRAPAEHRADGERNARVGDRPDREDLVEEEPLVGGEVGDGGLDEEIGVTRDDVARDDGGNGRERVLDLPRRLPRPLIDFERDENGQAETELLPIELGPVAGDEALGLERCACGAGPTRAA